LKCYDFSNPILFLPNTVKKLRVKTRFTTPGGGVAGYHPYLRTAPEIHPRHLPDGAFFEKKGRFKGK
jgi:hypothetical protein